MALLRGTLHVKCYSYHVRTSVIVNGECNSAWSETMYLIFNIQQTPTKYLYGHKYAAYNKQF